MISMKNWWDIIHAESVRETCSRDPANYYLDILLQVNGTLWYKQQQKRKYRKAICTGKIRVWSQAVVYIFLLLKSVNHYIYICITWNALRFLRIVCMLLFFAMFSSRARPSSLLSASRPVITWSCPLMRDSSWEILSERRSADCSDSSTTDLYL